MSEPFKYPGLPWKAEDEWVNPENGVQGPHCIALVSTAVMQLDDDASTAKRIARLFSVAPNMERLLRAMVRTMTTDDGISMETLVRVAEALLKKVEGEP